MHKDYILTLTSGTHLQWDLNSKFWIVTLDSSGTSGWTYEHVGIVYIPCQSYNLLKGAALKIDSFVSKGGKP